MSTLYQFEDNDIFMHHSRDSRPRPGDHPMHAHDMHELFYFMAGSGQYYIEGTAYPLIPGSLLLMQAGETHHLKIQSSYPYERIVIHFTPPTLKTVNSQILCQPFSDRPLGQYNQYRPDMFNQELIHNCLNAISTAGRLTQYDRERQRLMVLCNLYPVLCEIRRCFDRSDTVDSHTPDDMVSQVITYINSNLTNSFTLDTLATEFLTSKAYLNRQFKQITGSSIWDYTVTKRLLLARQHIRSGMPATDAAYLCGWNNYSAFYRGYKAKFGSSPSMVDKSQ